MKNQNFTDLLAWQKGRLLANDVYSLTRQFPKEETFGLTSQLRRCAVSVPSNVAEGYGRQHAKDSLNFFYIARGSLYEMETQLYISHDQHFLQLDELEVVLLHLTECKKLLHGFINHYKQKLS